MVLLADWMGLKTNVAWTIAGLFVALLVGSAIRIIALAKDRSEKRKSRIASLRTWWILTTLFLGSLVLGRGAVCLLFAVASTIGLAEYLALTHESRRDRVADILALLALPLHYLLIYFGREDVVVAFLPVCFLIILAIRLVTTGTTTGFVHDVSSVFWGVMLVGYLLSHAARITALDRKENLVGDWEGWLIYLVLLTELNDIAQALWGRQFGRHKVAPTVSPGKTWEGLLFGMATTVVAACALAPILTPLLELPAWIPLQWAIMAGLLISAGGFFGDITMSAVKRDVGVKDSGQLLPGQGGMLDRIDSLSFTAPIFYYFVLVLPQSLHA